MTQAHVTSPTASTTLSEDEASPVLVVIDDDATIRALVERVLTGYTIHSFERPREALAAFAAGLRPQLIVSDVQMPGMSGFELHAEVRRLPALRGVPFVYLTALADHESLRRGMVQGADDYLTKPFTPDELRQAVAVRLERHAALLRGEPPKLEVVTLGGLAVTAGGERLAWEARRVVVLLAYLLDHGGRASADGTRRALWSEAPADNHLHVLISRLRRTLREFGRVGIAGDEVQLELAIEHRWDVPVFEAAADAADGGDVGAIEAAIAAYAGPLLPGFDGPWVDARRAELEERYATLLDAAVEHAPDEIARARASARLDAYLDFD